AAVLLTAQHQGLHADTNRQHRLFPHLFAQNFVDAQTTDLCHAVAHRANAGEYQPVSCPEHFGIGGYRYLQRHTSTLAHVFQGLGHRMQVAHAVVDYCYMRHDRALAAQRALGGRYRALHARIGFDRHAQRTAKGLEHRLDLVMRVVASQIVDVQGYIGVVDEALKELVEQVHIEIADAAALERNVVLQTRAPGKVDHYAREGLVQRHIGM